MVIEWCHAIRGTYSFLCKVIFAFLKCMYTYYWPFACASYFLQENWHPPTNPSSWFWRYNAPMTLCVIYEIVYASIMQSFTSYLGCCTIWCNRPHSQLFYYVTSKDSAAKIWHYAFIGCKFLGSRSNFCIYCAQFSFMPNELTLLS